MQVLSNGVEADEMDDAGGALLTTLFVEPLSTAHANFGQFLKLVETPK